MVNWETIHTLEKQVSGTPETSMAELRILQAEGLKHQVLELGFFSHSRKFPFSHSL